MRRIGFSLNRSSPIFAAHYVVILTPALAIRGLALKIFGNPKIVWFLENVLEFERMFVTLKIFLDLKLPKNSKYAQNFQKMFMVSYNIGF